MKSIRWFWQIALLALTTVWLCTGAHAGIGAFTLQIPIQVDVAISPTPPPGDTVTGSFTYSVTCTNQGGGTSSFVFATPAATLNAAALVAPFSLNGNAFSSTGTALPPLDPAACVVKQIAKPASVPAGYAWDSAPVPDVVITSFSSDGSIFASTATFSNALAPITFTVTGIASPLAGGTVTCASPVNFNTTSSCTATANAGYSLTGISGCGGTASTTSPYTTGPVTANCSVTGTFALNTFTVTGVASPLAGGTVTCASPVNSGATTTCTATTNAGYALTGISGCGGTASTTSPYTTGPVTANCSVTGSFQALSFPVTTNVVVAGGGTLTCTPSPVTFGSKTTCAATANSGFTLTGISGCAGTATTTSPFVTGPITAACTVTGVFAAVVITPAVAVPTLDAWLLALAALLTAAFACFVLTTQRRTRRA